MHFEYIAENRTVLGLCMFRFLTQSSQIECVSCICVYIGWYYVRDVVLKCIAFIVTDIPLYQWFSTFFSLRTTFVR